MKTKPQLHVSVNLILVSLAALSLATSGEEATRHGPITCAIAALLGHPCGGSITWRSDQDGGHAIDIAREEFFLLSNMMSRCSTEQPNAKVQTGLFTFLEAFQNFPDHTAASVCYRRQGESAGAFKRFNGTIIQVKLFLRDPLEDME